MKSPISSWIFIWILFALILVGCGDVIPSNVDDSNNAAENQDVNSNDNSDSDQNNATLDEYNSSGTDAEATSSSFPPLPPEPQNIDIPLPDGRTLNGLYYPANTNPAPTIVLLHWAGGTKEDWSAIAPWLQNRGQPGPEFIHRTWLDSSWFPTLPTDASFGVFTFTFGGFGGSPGGDWEDFPLEALTVLQTVSQLPGVDPDQITTMGASIGADSSASSCYQYNQSNAEGKCLGSFSLSPGNYLLGKNLSETYDEVVAGQETFEFPVTIYCLAAENDGNSPATCMKAQQESLSNYYPFIYSGKDHGMVLITENAFPSNSESDQNTLELYLQFLESVYQIDLTP